MQLRLEELSYQQDAIESVVGIFDGTAKNSYENASRNGIRSNVLTVTPEEIAENLRKVFEINGISDETAMFEAPQIAESDFNGQIVSDRLPFDVCVEMETGTGKTLVYLKTIYELYKKYRFTKFIILTPTIPVRQGVMQTLRDFEKQLNDIFEFTPNYFEYDSKRIAEVGKFAQEQHPQIMVMTTAAITGDDRIINREQREDLFDNLPFIDLIARTRPIVIMDEPQMGMDADKTSKAIERLNPLVRLRYSATHRKEFTKNLVYRLTPADSYKQNLVKKIDVLTVVEKNDEASLKVELAEARSKNGSFQAKLKAWKKKADGEIRFEDTPWMKPGDDLAQKTNNAAYTGYVIENIWSDMMDDRWRVKFQNIDLELVENEVAGNIEAVWAMQMDFLVKTHFKRAAELKHKGIKCLSLIFINRVANYIGDDPIIKNLFIEKYKAHFLQHNNGNQPTAEQIENAQGYYFAKTSQGQFADNDGGEKEQKRIYDLILKDKKELLSLDNPVEFIFSHSALGVGWDNPNVFQIATLSTTYSEIKKRQEIGRGLRICVDQTGKRVYDAPDVTAKDRINQLTVIPNETYATFAAQYQSEIVEQYGDAKTGAGMTTSHKGTSKSEVTFTRNRNTDIERALQSFWDALARKTDYSVVFDDKRIIREAVEQISQITIPHTIVEAVLTSINDLEDIEATAEYRGTASQVIQTRFSTLDLIEELSEDTHLCYTTVIEIVKGIAASDEVLKQWIRNPPLFIQKAAAIIKRIELDAMVRGLSYTVTNEVIPFSFEDYVDQIADINNSIAKTPTRGVYDQQRIDSDFEKRFAEAADRDAQVVFVLKLPKSYKIPTPIGYYEPDFGIVLRRADIDGDFNGEFHYVIETKGTNNIDDTGALTADEIFKIKCAVRHFKALGVKLELEPNNIYHAPIREYSTFMDAVTEVVN